MADAIENDTAFANVKSCVDANKTLREDVLKRTTAIQTVVLQELGTSSGGKRGFVIGNTHLYFRPDADHIRLVQEPILYRLLLL